jgi:mRNA interferase RelE/StbE
VKPVTYSKDALRTLRRIPANVSATIRGKIEQYAEDPASQANNVIRMKGVEGCFRLRIGDWRVVFSEDAAIIAIIRIAPRGGVYD